MSYLSRIWLNPLRTRTQQFLRDPRALHAAVLGGLSRQPVTERVLWRIEADGPHRIGVLVLTESRPSWEHLVEQAGWPNAEDPQSLVRSYRPLLDQVHRGRQFALRVVANPTSSTKKPDKATPEQAKRLAGERPRGVRVAHRTASQQLRWFIDRVETWGFTLLDGEYGPAARLSARQRLVVRKRSEGGINTVTLDTATFDALVEVADPERASRSLLSGVGPGKAYGLGLITLAPPTPSRSRVRGR
jgi:CRISPR system Cascade subunit CasE